MEHDPQARDRRQSEFRKVAADVRRVIAGTGVTGTASAR